MALVRKRISTGKRISTSKHTRTGKGQAIVEGTAMLGLLVMVIVGGLILLLGTGLAIIHKEKIQYAAQSGADVGVTSKTWMGQLRPFYTPEDTKAAVTRAVNASLTGMGLQEADSIEVADDDETFKVTVVTHFHFLANLRFLPEVVELTAVAARAFPDDNPNAYGVVRGTNGRAIRFPAYAFRETLEEDPEQEYRAMWGKRLRRFLEPAGVTQRMATNVADTVRVTQFKK